MTLQIIYKTVEPRVHLASEIKQNTLHVVRQPRPTDG